MTARSKVGAVIVIAALSGCGGGGGGFAPGALGANGSSGGSPVLPQPPVPTSAPIVAHNPLIVSPAIVALDAPGDAASLVVSEVGYGGKLITYTGGCVGITTISPASEVASSNGSASFKITATKSNASCRPIFSDTYGQSGSSLANVGSPASPAPTTKPTASPVPTAQPTETPVPVAPTASPVPTMQPTSVPVPTTAPTQTPATPKPTVAPLPPTPAPTAEPTAQPTAVPTAQPTMQPTPAPNYGPLTVTPPSLALGDVNPDTGSFVVSETNYTGAFGESDNCSGIATITGPASGGKGPSSVYAVQDEAAGTCDVTFTDNHGGSVVRQIQVTTFGIIIQSKHRSGGVN